MIDFYKHKKPTFTIIIFAGYILHGTVSDAPWFIGLLDHKQYDYHTGLILATMSNHTSKVIILNYRITTHNKMPYGYK